MTTILIIEDHNEINEMLATSLTQAHYHCLQAYAGTEGWHYFQTEAVDLIILDLMLPGMDGQSLLVKIRAQSDLPIIVLTAKDTLECKVTLLGLGADDYLCKPFEIEELLARIQVQLRKRNKTANVITRYKELCLDADGYDAQIKKTPLHLTRHEYLILDLLMKHPRRVFTRQEIYEYVWGDDYYGDDKTINVHISHIRKKISIHTNEDYIQTVWGIGFKMAD